PPRAAAHALQDAPRGLRSEFGAAFVCTLPARPARAYASALRRGADRAGARAPPEGERHAVPADGARRSDGTVLASTARSAELENRSQCPTRQDPYRGGAAAPLRRSALHASGMPRRAPAHRASDVPLDVEHYGIRRRPSARLLRRRASLRTAA